MTRFALIDLDSGYVWGVYDADTPAAACQMSDRDNKAAPRTYTDTYRSQISGKSGFAVHAAPAGFDINDGQNSDEIQAVSALPLIGYFVASEQF